MADDDGPGLADYLVADPRVLTLLEMFPAAGLFSAWVDQKLCPFGTASVPELFEQFFTPSRELQGPDVEVIGQAYDSVITALDGTATGLNEFGATMLSALGEWEGDAKTRAAGYVGQVEDYVLEESVALNHLAGGLLAYGTLITAYRENLNNLMQAAGDACRQKDEADDAAILQFLIVSAAAIVGAVVTVVTAGAAAPAAAGGIAALGTYSAAAVTILGEAGSTAVQINSADWDTIRNSYLDQQQKLTDDLVEALGTDIGKQLAAAAHNMPPDISAPGGLGDEEQFHPESDPDHLAGDRATSSPIQAVLDGEPGSGS